MNIAIDLSPLQNAHRMRGIGYTLINFINNLPDEDRKNHGFTFYALPEGESLFKDPLELLDLEGMQYEVKNLKPLKKLPYPLPWRLNLPIAVVNRYLRWQAFYFGDPRIGSLNGIDVFLQADQNQVLPSGRHCKKVLIIYDLIPQILDWDYLRTYSSSRQQGASRKKSLVNACKRKLITRKLRLNTERADKLLAISQHTKKDFIDLFDLPADKITVTPLGANAPKVVENESVELHQYQKTGWGYVKNPLILDKDTPFLLFIGGVDRRRKLQDLISAFNIMRAQGRQLKLVLVGDILLGPSAVTTPEVSQALKQSSYLDDIIFMGFADDQVKDWLYRHALAFVFPSRYEGFGLPVLEAMIRQCPVICYKNAATHEVAGEVPMYVDNYQEIIGAVVRLLSMDSSQLDAVRKGGLAHARQYDWTKTSTKMMKAISD